MRSGSTVLVHTTVSGGPAGREASRAATTSSTWSVVNTDNTTRWQARASSASERAGRPPSVAKASTFFGSTS